MINGLPGPGGKNIRKKKKRAKQRKSPSFAAPVIAVSVGCRQIFSTHFSIRSFKRADSEIEKKGKKKKTKEEREGRKRKVLPSLLPFIL